MTPSTRHFLIRGTLTTLGCLALISPQSVSAADVKGSQDHPLITRYPGSQIVGFFHSDFESVQFPRGTDIDYNTANFKTADTVEGDLTRIVYLSPTGKGPLEVFRNYEQALKTAGLKVKFSRKRIRCLTWRRSLN